MEGGSLVACSGAQFAKAQVPSFNMFCLRGGLLVPFCVVHFWDAAPLKVYYCRAYMHDSNYERSQRCSVLIFQ